MRRLLPFALMLLVAGAASGVDEPHWILYSTNCLGCHSIHAAAGQNLTTAISNESLCTSCHNLVGSAARYPNEKLLKADPANRLGSSHAWNVPPTNAGAGAQTPLDVQMALRATDNILCSTCHNQHKNLAAGVASGLAGKQVTSAAVRTSGGGTGSVTYTATANVIPRGYLLEIIEAAGAAGVAKFRLSVDGGTSWWGWSTATSNWVAYAAGNAQLTGTNVQLKDGSDVLATFSGDFVIGDRIRFYISYPFLRAQLDSGDNTTGVKFCRDCHRSMAMDHIGVNDWDGEMKSHPVGIPLNANGGGYDRATPLDADGLPQGGSADTNPTNDLALAADSTIQCLTCHGVHHADGNSNTVDVP